MTYCRVPEVSMEKQKALQLRIGGIFGNLYTSGKSSTVVLYGKGAPSVPDSGKLKEARIVSAYKTDIFVPDYIGYGRSDGLFTPMNCIRTFLIMRKYLLSGAIGINYGERIRKKLEYKRVIIIGKSFGGRYVSLLPKFNKEIREIGLFSPALETSAYGKGEESNEDFFRVMEKDGYSHMYRGVLSKKWKRHLEDIDALAPIKNIRHLGMAKIFIAHGMEDKSIRFSRSVSYYKRILDEFPEKEKSSIKLRLYRNVGHEGLGARAIADCMDWFGVEREFASSCTTGS